jgi:23S rRNA (cytosine1962-C5)-methyltransferase
MRAHPRVTLRAGREKAVLRGHPWVFSGAVTALDTGIAPGEIADVYSSDGRFLARGQANPLSQIIVRVLTRKEENVGPDFYRRRIQTALALRKGRGHGTAPAFRLINAEGDFLPGLVVDRYGEVLVLQCLTAGMERPKGLIVELLVDLLRPLTVYERSDVSARKEEGLPETQGLLYGTTAPERLEIEEEGCRFLVDVKNGQKTGFYVDQADNRLEVQRLSRDKNVLDCFCYTGAFSIHALKGGAERVTMVDASEDALHLAEQHLALNGLEEVPRRLIRGDAFQIMRTLDPGFDIIVLDPPPFAKKKANLPKASRGYKDINLQAFRLLSRGGLLFTFSCSHHMDPDLFQKIVFAAGVDSGRRIQLLARRGHPFDHPIDLSHPEGEYLKGLICRAL